MNITIPQLAKLCGVSRGTVDRALNNRPGIRQETKDLILATARTYGYTPNSLARSLVTGKTGTIGILVFDFRNRHFAQLLDAAETRLTQLGYNSYICISEKDPAREIRVVEDMLSRNVEGIILMPVSSPGDFDRQFPSLSVPVVAVSNRLSERFSYVGANFASAAFQATEGLFQSGYRHISFVCPAIQYGDRENIFAQAQRVLGYQQFMAAHPDLTGMLIDSYDYIDRIREDLKSIPHPAYFCSSDYYALQILVEARASGLRIPEDFGLLGYDGIDTLDYIEPTIATIEYPVSEVGIRAVELVDRMIRDGAGPQSILVNTTFRFGCSI